jgi:diguanylate cyclase (GGDEF)-like protein
MWTLEGARNRAAPRQLSVGVRTLLKVAAAVLATAHHSGAAVRRADPALEGARPFRIFRDADGLPNNTVHAIALDQHGYLWVGTQSGAARYDGRRWTTVHMPNRTLSDFVRAILPSHDGSIWFGTQAGGLLRLRNGKPESPGIALPDVRHHRINALVETLDSLGNPVLWAATHDGGVVRIGRGLTTVFDELTGLPSNRVWSLFKSTGGSGETTIWAGTETGLAKLDQGSGRFVRTPEYPSQSITSMLELPGNNGERAFWVGTYGGGVAILEGGRWSRLDTAKGLPSNHVTSLARDSFATGPPAVWIGTDGGGIAHVQGDRVEPVDVTEGMPSNAVYSLLETHSEEGVSALWVGTRNGGLVRIKDGQWRSFQPVPTLASLPVLALLETRETDGSMAVWFGTDGGGLAKLHAGSWTVFTQRTSGLPSDTITSLAESADGARAVWVGTRNGGLARLSSGAWKVFDSQTRALPNNLIQTTLTTSDEDGGASLWVGTRGGLARLHRGRWSVYDTLSASLPSNSVRCLLETRGNDGEQTLWVGTTAGLASLRHGQWSAYSAQPALLNPSVECLHATSSPGGRQVLWIGTDGGGIARLDIESGNWLPPINEESQPALPDNVVYQILEDRENTLYVLTNRGVARLIQRQARGGEGSTLDLYTYTVEDGLPQNQGNRGAAMIDSQGRVWVGTVAGAAVFDPQQSRADTTPKKLLLTGSVISDDGTRLAPHVRLDHRHRHVAFDYALLSFFREGDTRYRTQLMGLEAAPTAWLPDGRREYVSLPARAYTFRVWGRDYAGNISGPVELPFAIHPPPWLSWWFLTLAGGLLLGVIWLATQVRLRTLDRRQEQLVELVAARTRELAEANQFLIELSYLDALTGVANRRRFDEHLDAEWRRALRAEAPLSLILIDIDCFKRYNDTYGHQNGDECLQAVATALADGLPRSGDSVARYGGEEFAIVLPFTDKAGAIKVAEQLRHRIEALQIPNKASTVSRFVTISAGAATFVPARDIDVHELIRLADEALYRAKQAGRNRTAAEHSQPRSSGILPAPPVR